MTIEQWKDEVKNYLTELKEIISKNPALKELCYGYSVIDGRINQNPEILFIGINAGKGDGQRKDSINIETDHNSYIDPLIPEFYEDYESPYKLAESSIELLKKVGFTEEEIIDKLQNNFVNTNQYYVDTKIADDIASFRNHIPTFFHQSCYITIELIRILQPKIIIFEGKSSYDNIVEVCIDAKNTWNKTEEIGQYFFEESNSLILGYGRNRFGNISYNQENLASLIKENL